MCAIYGVQCYMSMYIHSVFNVKMKSDADRCIALARGFSQVLTRARIAMPITDSSLSAGQNMSVESDAGERVARSDASRSHQTLH